MGPSSKELSTLPSCDEIAEPIIRVRVKNSCEREKTDKTTASPHQGVPVLVQTTKEHILEKAVSREKKWYCLVPMRLGIDVKAEVMETVDDGGGRGGGKRLWLEPAVKILCHLACKA